MSFQEEEELERMRVLADKMREDLFADALVVVAVKFLPNGNIASHLRATSKVIARHDSVRAFFEVMNSIEEFAKKFLSGESTRHVF